jgi:hypothetical protein
MNKASELLAKLMKIRDSETDSSDIKIGYEST